MLTAAGVLEQNTFEKGVEILGILLINLDFQLTVDWESRWPSQHTSDLKTEAKTATSSI